MAALRPPKSVTAQRTRLDRHSLLTTVLLLAIAAVLAVLGERYSYRADWTATARNTLSPASIRLLERIDGRIQITAYARTDQILRRAIAELVDRYRQVKPELSLEFVNPDRVPEQTRRLGVSDDGDLVVRLGERHEVVHHLSEEKLTSALYRLALRADRWVVYLTGHGERDLLGQANHDLGRFGRALRERGYAVHALNLANTPRVPDNTAVLVISEPTVALVAAESEAVAAFLQRGGNMLWLDDPNGSGQDAGPGMAKIQANLGVQPREGVVVDPTSAYPGIVIISNPGQHAVVREFELNTLFPLAAALRVTPVDGWESTPILHSGDQSWVETGPLTGELRYDSNADSQGPVNLGVVMQRTPATASADTVKQHADEAGQRLVMVGDSDFLSNAYVGNGGNLDLGLSLVNWLSNEDALVSIPSARAPDLRFDPSTFGRFVIALGAPVALPLTLLCVGFLVWRRRRRR